MLFVLSVGLEIGTRYIRHKNSGKRIKASEFFNALPLMLFTALQLGIPTWYMAICVLVLLQGLLKFQLTGQPTWECFLTLYDSQRSTMKIKFVEFFHPHKKPLTSNNDGGLTLFNNWPWKSRWFPETSSFYCEDESLKT